MTQTPWTDDVRQAAKCIRRRVLEHTLKHNGGYLSQACSSAEILSTMYLKVMNLAPLEEPLWCTESHRRASRGFTVVIIQEASEA